MFENKRKINSESEKELLVARKKILECQKNSEKKRLEDFYNKNLTVIINEDENSDIEAFGYCYKLNEELGMGYGTKMICIKYKSKDEWEKIYEYKFGQDYDAYYFDDKIVRYDVLNECMRLSSKDINTIFEFIRYRDDALKIFNIYLETFEKRRNRR